MSKLASFLVVCAVASCVAHDESTQITVAFSSETSIPSELDSLRVQIRDARGAVTYQNDYDVLEPAFFPTTLAIVPAGEESFDGPIRVDVTGIGANGAVRLERTAIVAFARGRNLLVPMPLRMACVNFPSCAAGETCRGGQCLDAQLFAPELREYADEQVYARAGGSCFDEVQCTADATALQINADCTFELPGDGNVGLVWAAAPERLLVLDAADPLEGWSVREDGRGMLSRGACASLLDPETDPSKRAVPDRALEAYFSRACSAKGPALPYCPANDGHSGIGAPKR